MRSHELNAVGIIATGCRRLRFSTTRVWNAPAERHDQRSTRELVGVDDQGARAAEDATMHDDPAPEE